MTIARGLGGMAAALMLMAGAAACGPSANAGVPASASARAHHRQRTGVVRVRGQVTSLTAQTIVVRTRRGRSLKFAIASNTKYRQKRAAIRPAAIPVGATVIVVGKRVAGSASPQAVVVRLLKP